MPKAAGVRPPAGMLLQDSWHADADSAALSAMEGYGAGVSDLMTGVVKTWRDERGFGFITPDGGADDVFVHRSVLSDGPSLLEGSSVLFDVTYDVGRKGFKATKVV